MNEVVEQALRELLQSPAVDSATADAQGAWVRLQFGLATRWSLPEDVVAIGHQVALLSVDVPPSIDEIPSDLRARLESLATSFDIAARVTAAREREFSKLAAGIYLTAQQPTRALRAIRRLRSVDGLDAALMRFHRVLENSYRLTGENAVEIVNDATSRETFSERGHAFLEALEATSSEPALFRVLREAEVALRYREEHPSLTE